MEAMLGNSTFTFVTRSLEANIRNLNPGDFYEIKVQAMANGALSIPVEDVQSTSEFYKSIQSSVFSSSLPIAALRAKLEGDCEPHSRCGANKNGAVHQNLVASKNHVEWLIESSGWPEST